MCASGVGAEWGLAVEAAVVETWVAWNVVGVVVLEGRVAPAMVGNKVRMEEDTVAAKV